MEKGKDKVMGWDLIQGLVSLSEKGTEMQARNDRGRDGSDTATVQGH